MKLNISDDKVQEMGGFIEKAKVIEFEKFKQSRDQDITWLPHGLTLGLWRMQGMNENDTHKQKASESNAA